MLHNEKQKKNRFVSFRPFIAAFIAMLSIASASDVTTRVGVFYSEPKLLRVKLSGLLPSFFFGDFFLFFFHCRC
jgi:hypothetical protein